MITIAVLSQKGGVGKTVTVANVAAALAAHGLRVLMVDLDPQADLSASWGVEDDDAVVRVEGLLGGDGDPRAAAIELVAHGAGRLSLLPAGQGLRRLTGRLLAGDSGQLADLLAPFAAEVDVVLVDTPAGETVFGAQAIVAADWAVVTVLPGFNELRALNRVLDAIDRQALAEETPLGLLGVLLVNAEERWRTTRAYTEHLDAEEVSLFSTIVPRHQPVTDHARFGRPTIVLQPDGKVAAAYRRVAAELVGRLAAHHPAPLPAPIAAARAVAGPSR